MLYDYKVGVVVAASHELMNDPDVQIPLRGIKSTVFGCVFGLTAGQLALVCSSYPITLQTHYIISNARLDRRDLYNLS